MISLLYCFVSELALFMQKQLNVHTDRNLT